jgi:exo-1,4-beta-D-glucosaminidase
MQSSFLVKEDAETVSSSAFRPEGWYPLEIPSTVLTALVKNGVYPDPYVGLNNMLIPDASEEFSRKYDLLKYSHLPEERNPWKDPYWFRTEFRLPADSRERRTWLHLAGIHYRADIWVNGRKLAGPGDVVGMFGDWSFDISDVVKRDSHNVLAVLIHPLDYPGLPGEPQLQAFGAFGLNGGETGDIGKNVTMQSAVGWDWIPAVRDRNMGIWQEVYITFTGPVDVRHPYIQTDLPLPQIDKAYLRVTADVVNLTPGVQKGTVWLKIFSRGVSKPLVAVKKSVQLAPRQTLQIIFYPEAYPELIFPAPRLWWPNVYGEPALYEMETGFDLPENVSDSERRVFGIREVESRLQTGGEWSRRDFYINGKKIMLRGGAWVPDMMLDRDSVKLFHELLLVQKANLNTVRIWGGGVTPPEEFFTLCDELGLLVWHDFWITGDCQGTWGKGSQDYPLEETVFLQNAEDVVKRLRNHPSLLVWTAGNEGYPRENIYIPLRNELLAGLDGTRPFLPSSGYREPPREWGLSWPDNRKAGTYSGGPYHWVDPREYYALIEKKEDWLFKNEVGLPSVPVLDSLKKFIPDLSPDPEVRFPLNHVWGYHDACEGNGKFSLYDQALRDRYGEPQDLEDYVRKAQLLNAEGYRGIFEAVSQSRDYVSGVLLWKTNPAWPSVIWQLYDWYLRPHAGYYFAKKACAPVHIQLNPIDHEVVVVNHTWKARNGLSVVAEVYGENMRKVWERSMPLDLPPVSVQNAFKVSLPSAWEDEMFVIRLRMQTQSGRLEADNLYWSAGNDDYTSLADLPAAAVETEVIRTDRRDDFARVTFRFSNPTDKLAFFLNPSIRFNASHEEILPSYWSENYFSLLPGESKRVSVHFRESALDHPGVYMRMEGWNLKRKHLELPAEVF